MIVNKTRRLMAFFFPSSWHCTHTRHISVVWNGRSDDQCTIHCQPLRPSEAEVWAAASSPAGSACLSSKGIVNSICSERERESDSQQQSDWTNGPASSQSFSHLIWQSFFLLLLPDCVVYHSFLLVSTQFHPSAHTHTHADRHTHSLLFFCAGRFFLLLALSHLFSNNSIAFDLMADRVMAKLAGKSPAGRLIRRHCLFWRVDGL